MKRYSEVVLDGHPDRFCDLVADRIVALVSRENPDAFIQIEASVWNDRIFLTGSMVTSKSFSLEVKSVVSQVGIETGYANGNFINVSGFEVIDQITRVVADPLLWTAYCNDQCIVIGYAGYDMLTNYLPPEHFAAGFFRDELITSMKGGRLTGYGPDGKILMVMEEYPGEWKMVKLLVTLQQPEKETFSHFLEVVSSELRLIYGKLQQYDRRWSMDWTGIEVIVNPNGPLVLAGMFGDNGQTGRKVVMDHYGPRIPIGGGAIYGKHYTHIDRLGSTEARRLCVDLVMAGSSEALLRLAYAPGCDAPLDSTLEANLRPRVDLPEHFGYGKMRERFFKGQVK